MQARQEAREAAQKSAQPAQPPQPEPHTTMADHSCGTISEETIVEDAPSPAIPMAAGGDQYAVRAMAAMAGARAEQVIQAAAACARGSAAFDRGDYATRSRESSDAEREADDPARNTFAKDETMTETPRTSPRVAAGLGKEEQAEEEQDWSFGNL
jgi:hypothetical protein